MCPCLFFFFAHLETYFILACVSEVVSYSNLALYIVISLYLLMSEELPENCLDKPAALF